MPDAPTWGMKRALQVILAIGVFGLLFSGYLSYGELYAPRTGPACPTVGEPGTILGYPACVYGFFMYLAIVVVASVGLFSGSPRRARERSFGAVL